MIQGSEYLIVMTSWNLTLTDRKSHTRIGVSWTLQMSRVLDLLHQVFNGNSKECFEDFAATQFEI